MTVVLNLDVNTNEKISKESLEDKYADPEGFVDEEPAIRAKEELMDKMPRKNKYEERCVVVFGIPVIGKERVQKLSNVLKKIIGSTSDEFEETIPLSPEGGTKGLLFIEYPNKDIALKGADLLNGYVLDKNHTFKAMTITSVKNIQKPDPNWKKPEVREYVDAGNVYSHLTHKKCLDQFGVQYCSNREKEPIHLGVYWFQREQEPVLADNEANRANWSELPFRWSPKGTYITTLHSLGVQIWGGPTFNRIQRFSHPQPIFVDFSPQEKFIVVFSNPFSSSQGSKSTTVCCTIFNIMSGDVVKQFTALQLGLTKEDSKPIWPIFKWSCDDKYCGYVKRKSDSAIIFNCDDFSTSDTLPLSNVSKIEWSPNNSRIAYYCQENIKTSAPAEIGIMSYPGKEKIRAARVFNCSKAELFWHTSGRFFAVVSERYGKRTIKDNEVKYFNIITHVDIFDCQVKDIPLLNLTIDDQFKSFAWDPSSEKFAILCGTSIKTTSFIYNVEKTKHVPTLLLKLDEPSIHSTLKFSPFGSWLVIAGCKNIGGGSLVFVDCSTNEPTKMKTTDHSDMTSCKWDPTGRYFVSICSKPRADNGYVIYNFQGKILYKAQYDVLVRFDWRPRLKLEGHENRVAEVKKNFKKFTSQFEEEDRIEKDAVYRDIVVKRREIFEDFKKIRELYLKQYALEAPIRKELRNGIDTDKIFENCEYVNQEVTVVVRSSETTETSN
ncbi:Eukaryotic translation initiation factor 3 subunit B [Strongyloides ratti]|uniref:Eukaryotic translation initiation factor 3 subunit B n=1 Tax=Strongyloides ratti TaxID=34506 RepID=A0A090LK27_STRRB|nr:Eukaryotic translation initiation factor 3 subunit B [Strongyloides ratti]CEF67895.1 Eukaryotic translation initiation factor 3 subunit B [Strongyloides ratti]